MLMNFLTALAAVIGGVAGFWLASAYGNFIGLLLPITAGGFIYICASDLVPELHKEPDLNKALPAFAVFVFGILFMWALRLFLSEFLFWNCRQEKSTNDCMFGFRIEEVGFEMMFRYNDLIEKFADALGTPKYMIEDTFAKPDKTDVAIDKYISIKDFGEYSILIILTPLETTSTSYALSAYTTGCLTAQAIPTSAGR